MIELINGLVYYRNILAKAAFSDVRALV